MRPYFKKNKNQNIKKNHTKKRTGGVAQGVGPEFKSQYCKRKKKRKKERNEDKEAGEASSEAGFELGAMQLRGEHHGALLWAAARDCSQACGQTPGELRSPGGWARVNMAQDTKV
jgi:hypothetical protein